MTVSTPLNFRVFQLSSHDPENQGPAGATTYSTRVALCRTDIVRIEEVAPLGMGNPQRVTILVAFNSQGTAPASYAVRGSYKEIVEWWSDGRG